jgi:hypothetical protein
MRRALVLVALAACTDYAQLSLKNAPGNVDLGQPLPHENGDPARIEAPADPGSDNVAAIAAPYILGGLGRYSSPSGSGEVGLELRFERASNALLQARNWSLTAGMAFVQWGDNRYAAPGAFYGEFGYRFIAGDTLPIEIAGGPLLYVDDSSAGAQLTFRMLGIMMLRSRYVANTGYEVMGGIEIPIPFFFGWSK